MAASRKADRTSPLRLVAAVVEHPTSWASMVVRELLECGHLHRPSTSWHGSYPGEATRRRCKKCARGAARDYPPHRVAELSRRYDVVDKLEAPMERLEADELRDDRLVDLAADVGGMEFWRGRIVMDGRDVTVGEITVAFAPAVVGFVVAERPGKVHGWFAAGDRPEVEHGYWLWCYRPRALEQLDDHDLPELDDHAS